PIGAGVAWIAPRRVVPGVPNGRGGLKIRDRSPLIFPDLQCSLSCRTNSADASAKLGHRSSVAFGLDVGGAGRGAAGSGQDRRWERPSPVGPRSSLRISKSSHCAPPGELALFSRVLCIDQWTSTVKSRTVFRTVCPARSK